ncbi:hypothetical protein [Flavobacterium sp.]|uniref:hypothetical protein n=1 Tax=Flavobacterium sp. TaxID=239 RepID=UPI00262C7390|nr:hypothetical protein [Flavobacterium sp.]
MLEHKIVDVEKDMKDCYNGNYNIAKAGISHSYTEEQLTEIIKCKKDIIYFIENYVKIINLDEGMVPFKLYDYQKEMITAFKENKYIICLLARQMGKCVTYSTIINIRNKKTNQVQEIEIGKFYNLIREENLRSTTNKNM